MVVRKKRSLTAAGVTRETLEETPARVMAFLFGVGTRPTVKADLANFGYTDAVHEDGWVRFKDVGNRSVEQRRLDPNVVAALRELDSSDELYYRLLGACLTSFPDVKQMVLEGIVPVVGPGSVLNMSTMLERLDKLEETEEGRLALARLAAAKIDKAERERMAGLVKVATSTPTQSAFPTDDAAFEQSLLSLREWYVEWSEIARIAIRRRDHLIALGLASRRSGGGTTDEMDVVDPTPFVTDPSPSPFVTDPADPSDPDPET
jgi:hypothetical protein